MFSIQARSLFYPTHKFDVPAKIKIGTRGTLHSDAGLIWRFLVASLMLGSGHIILLLAGNIGVDSLSKNHITKNPVFFLSYRGSVAGKLKVIDRDLSGSQTEKLNWVEQSEIEKNNQVKLSETKWNQVKTKLSGTKWK